MRYVSTRGRAPERGFCDILLSGLADDGGLYVPAQYPHVDRAQLESWRALDYADLATEVLALFATDIARERLAAMCRATYTAAAFGNARAGSDAAAIAPLRQLEPGLALLELSNGPTLAFKDMAMQLLGALFEHVLHERGGRLNVLGATSGDTGSAAEYALRGRPGINVFMLSPQGRMSAFQRAQMYSLQDANVHNLAVAGTFDDCQDAVKAIAGDLEFKARWSIGSVNSINWGRIVAQVVYYFHGYLQATTSSEQAVSFAVPSGNFGNILSGWIARNMGLPIDRLVLATNENDVLDEFFRTGRYRVRGGGETHATSSPSMDISKASNFERYIYDVVGRDPLIVRELWWEIDTRGEFHLAGTPFFDVVRSSGVVSGRSTHLDRLRTIRLVEQRHGVVIDPHTADGIKVALEHRDSAVPMICLETALPAKFAATIVEAIGRPPERPSAYAGLESLPQRFECIGNDTEAIKSHIAARAGRPAGAGR
ncbi:MAG: threonine synthase [Burkholderiaceae bacterium]|nr:threonine synthase [Burkholderiaceae bacterium]